MCPFTQDVQLIGNLLKRSKDRPRHSENYYPSELVENIVLQYPGKKNRGIDYLLRLNNKIVYHSDIANIFYDYSNQGFSLGLTNFILNLFEHGLEANHEEDLPETIIILEEVLTFEEFKHLVYFTILQEDINYPRPRFYGIAMPLIRFLESIIASQQADLINLDTVVTRINNHGGPPPRPFAHPMLEDRFVRALNILEQR